MNTTLIQSYVFHKEKCFYVSTINRESSAMLAAGRIYAETFAWDFDFETKKRGNVVAQAESSKDSIREHMNVCTDLYETGSYES